MKRQGLSDLRAAIEANTQRRSLDDLKKQGKRHVRVVSGEKVMKIIQAIVNDIVDREVGQTTAEHRERIAQRTKGEFDRVLKMQTDQDGLINQQKDTIEALTSRLEKAVAKVDGARKELEGSRAELLGKELELKQQRARANEESERVIGVQEGLRARDVEIGQLQARLNDETERAAELREQLKKREQKMDQLSSASADEGQRVNDLRDELHVAQSELESLRTQGTDAQMRSEQLTGTLKARDERLGEVTGELQERKLELERVRAERDMLSSEITNLRDRAAESGVVQQFQSELAEMKAAMLAMNDRPAVADDAVVQAIVEQLTERETTSSTGMEERFAAQLDRSLDEIQRTMKLATASPIDVVVEATDVLVDKIFDHDIDELSTNLDELELEETTSSASIGSSLDRLRAMRAGTPAQEEAPVSESESNEDDNDATEAFPAEGNHGPTAEEESVSDTSKEKLATSMDRLKAVRGNANEDD